MSGFRTVNVCLSDIPKEKIYKSEKTGKAYITLVIGDKDQVDQFGHDVSVSISQTKEERASKAKKTYVGNGKMYNTEKKPDNSGSDKGEYDPFHPDSQDGLSDLPF